MKALIAMSGGVDSSVSALLMKQAGYECVGCTMRLYDNEMIGEDLHSTCCSQKDTRDARLVTLRLGIPYYIFHYEEQFRDTLIEPFVCAYEEGRTPNPCIECNRIFKFGLLQEQMKELECDCVVTGHYARIEEDPQNGRMLLKKGLDASKDQSYVLYTMTQEQLKNTRFPLGTLRKEEVRRIAEENGFTNAHKSDSQDICFVPDGDYVGFMERFRGTEYPKGDFVDREGHVIGRHKGYVHYTIGQRRGLGIAAAHPLYVLEVRPEDNVVVLGREEELFRKELFAGQVNLISVEKLTGPMRVSAKIRYRHKEQPATVYPEQDGRIRVVFDEAQRAITPGQAVVLYQDDVVVGGGVIE
ncbi:MAG: tRNA 2-thiouridine(34) synthase MnmA [Lachnospiraceae bacterium]|nr:tRNA 2-thiouridine(34) synthase MnmA [Lachnospiraceae bacterium]